MTTTIDTRRFTAEVRGSRFVIIEVELASAPNMIGSTYVVIDGVTTAVVSRNAAWDLARRQALPVTVITLDGVHTRLGVVFAPAQFERAAYSGYVGYGLSMTDGYYAPIQFDAWVKSFRNHADAELRYGNDFRPGDGALDMYKAALLDLHDRTATATV